MTRRTGPARVVAIARKAREPAITVGEVQGGPVAMTPDLAHWIRIAVDRGRKIRAGSGS